VRLSRLDLLDWLWGRMLLFGHRVVPSLRGLLPLLREAVNAGRYHHHVSLNAMKVARCAEDPAFSALVAAAHTRAADGASLLLAARLRGHRVPERIAGCDLAEALLGLAALHRWPTALIGASPAVLAKVVDQVRARGVDVVCAVDGFGPRPDDLFGARLVLVALGTPTAERWIHETQPAALCLGVGGAFDVWAGEVPRAPIALQRVGLEGVARVAREPRKRLLPFAKAALRFARELPRA
jgi:N-acetylglucosaminyldiphosphoundecaprenol N-acetyl-beta-D-mannosaminyltransferase